MREEERLVRREIGQDGDSACGDSVSVDAASGGDNSTGVNFGTLKIRWFNILSSASSSSSSSSCVSTVLFSPPFDLVTSFFPPYLRYLLRRHEYLLEEIHRNLGFYYFDVFTFAPAFYHFLLSNFDPFFILCFSPIVTHKSTFLTLQQLHYQVYMKFHFCFYFE
jgi:hypothetical protein